MSILSLQYIGLTVFAFFLMFAAGKVKRKYTVLLCNIVFLILLGNMRDRLYVTLLSAYVFVAGRAAAKALKSAVPLCIPPVLGLVFYKYAGGFLPGRIIMPLGLSFYTFKAVSYIADVGRRKLRSRDLISVFDYLVFFPAFMAGPIHRPKEFFSELRSEAVFDYTERRNAFLQAVFGAVEKLVIADELALMADRLFAADGRYSLLAVIVYAFRIYADFDSYSNIAIGTAGMLGFHLKPNFRMPYLSATLREFWERWHISLSEWLRDYVYIPLGGSRRGTVRKYLNILIVFLVSGIWHGSTWMFVFWGLGHGIVRIIEDILIGRREIPKALRPLMILVNFIIVSLLWVFFRSASMAEAFSVLSSLRPDFAFDPEVLGITVNEWYWMFVLILILIVTDLFREKRDMVVWLSERPAVVRWLIYAAVMVFAVIFGVYGPGYHPGDFIYVTF